MCLSTLNPTTKNWCGCSNDNQSNWVNYKDMRQPTDNLLINWHPKAIEKGCVIQILWRKSQSLGKEFHKMFWAVSTPQLLVIMGSVECRKDGSKKVGIWQPKWREIWFLLGGIQCYIYWIWIFRHQHAAIELNAQTCNNLQIYLQHLLILDLTYKV